MNGLQSARDPNQKSTVSLASKELLKKQLVEQQKLKWEAMEKEKIDTQLNEQHRILKNLSNLNKVAKNRVYKALKVQEKPV